ncbi:MAG: MFS transporter, partial [Bacteroidota bacterium]
MTKTTYWLLAGMQFLLYLAWSIWMVSTATYLLNSLQFNGTQVGLIYGAPALAALVSPFLFGVLADRYISSDRLIAMLQFISGILLITLSKVDDFVSFYTLMIIQSFVFAPALSLGTAIIFHHAVDRERDFPRIRLWGTIGFIAGSAVVSLLEWEDTANALYYGGLSSILMAAYCLLLPHTPPAPRKTNTTSKRMSAQAWKVFLLNRTFIIFIICVTLIRIPASFYYTFVNPFLVEIGMQQPTLKMATGQVVEIVVMLSVPFMLRQFGIKVVMLLGFLGWGARYIGLAYGSLEESAYLLYFALAAHGFCYCYASISAHIFIDQSVPAHLRSTAQGFMMFLTMGLGMLIGTTIAGKVVDMNTFIETGTADVVRNWTAIWQFPAFV